MVFTIFNCGTGYDELNSFETTAFLFGKTQGQRTQTKLITAGPGSELATRQGYVAPLDKTPQQIPKPGWTDWNQPGRKSRGLTSGKGMEENADQVIKFLKSMNQLPQTINMLGWSRGAITSHLMANKFARDTTLSGIPLNIFSIDPVPGTGNLRNTDYSNIPSNVRNIEVIYQENECRKIMQAALLTFSTTNTKRTFYHLPGVHGCGADSIYEAFPSVHKVCTHLGATFLRKHGTLLQPGAYLMDKRQVLEAYSEMIRQTAKLFGEGKNVRYMGNSNAWQAVKNHLCNQEGYFINAHHDRTFQDLFPRVYYDIFVRLNTWEIQNYAISTSLEKSESKLTFKTLNNQMKTMKQTAPNTWFSLVNFKKWTETTRKTALKTYKNAPHKPQ